MARYYISLQMRARIIRLIKEGKCITAIAQETGKGHISIRKLAEANGLEITLGRKHTPSKPKEKPQPRPPAKLTWDFTGQDIIDTDTRKYREQW